MKIRWQDWVDVLLGFWLIFSPWEMGFTLNGAATANAHGLGAVLIIFNLLVAARLLDEGQEIFNILLGAWLILSPYALDFATDQVPLVNFTMVGIMIVALAGWQIYDATKMRKK